MSTEAKRTRGVVLGAVTGFALTHIAWEALAAYQIHRLRSGAMEAARAIELQMKIFPLLNAAVAVALLVALAAVGKRSPQSRRPLLRIAMGATAVFAGLELLVWVDRVAQLESSVLRRHVFWGIHSLSFAVSVAASAASMLLAFGRGTGGGRLAYGLPLLFWSGSRLIGALSLLLDHRPPFYIGWTPTKRLIFEMAPWVSGFGILLYVIWRTDRGALEESVAMDANRNAAPDESYEYYRRWDPAADGLKLYGDALAWRLAVAVIGYSLMLFAVLGKSADMMKLIAWLMPTLALIAVIAMMVGLFRFASQPAESPGKAPAMFGALGMLVGVCFEGYALIMIFKVLTAGTPHSMGAYEEIQEAAKSAQSASMWAMGVGFAALVVTLIAMGTVAKYLRRSALVKSVTNAGILIVAAAVFALWFRSYLPESNMGEGEAIFLALVVLIFAISVVSYYISVVRRVEEAMRGSGDPPEVDLPAARIVERD